MVNLGERSARTGPAADSKNIYLFQWLTFMAEGFWSTRGTAFSAPSARFAVVGYRKGRAALIASRECGLY
jgi:hypothetical protein